MIIPLALLLLAACSGEDNGNQGGEEGGDNTAAAAPASAPTGPPPETPQIVLPPQPKGSPTWLDTDPAPGGPEVDTPSTDASATAARDGVLPTSPPRLQPMNYAEFKRAHVLGAGCTWSRRGSKAVLFVGTSERGAYKMGGDVVQVTPDPASERLPLGARTRYRGEAISFALSPSGQPTQTGYEVVSQPAMLSVEGDGIDPAPLAGTLNCGA